MASLKHVHIYIRKTGTANQPYESVYMCQDPHCTQVELAINLKGKASVCSKCGLEEIILDYHQLD